MMEAKELKNWKKYGNECEKEFVAIFEEKKLARIIEAITKTGDPVMLECEYRKKFYRVNFFSYYQLMCFLEILLNNVGVDEIKLRILHGLTMETIMEWTND